jgi:putative transposase
MKLEQDRLYHIYNQGNNKERIFYNSENYLYFLRKFRQLVLPHCDVIAYCLMPNHFHFLINSNKNSVELVQIGGIFMNKVTNGFRLLLSDYAQEINEQKKRSGALFRPKTKAKLVEKQNEFYPSVCFHYIHQNPIKANLATKIEQWPYSSFNDYAGFRDGTLCNQLLGVELLNISSENFYEESCQIVEEKFKEYFF